MQRFMPCFVDFQKAFDSVWHNGLFLKLLESGIGGKTYDLIKSMYTYGKCSIKVGTRKTESFFQRRGVRQGCKLSPILFNIYINEMSKQIKNSHAPGLSLNSTKQNVAYKQWRTRCLQIKQTYKTLTKHTKQNPSMPSVPS